MPTITGPTIGAPQAVAEPPVIVPTPAPPPEREEPPEPKLGEPLEPVSLVPKPDLEETHQKPGAGDMWIRKTDYERLTGDQRRLYDRSGWEALKPELEAEARRKAAEIAKPKPPRYGRMISKTHYRYIRPRYRHILGAKGTRPTRELIPGTGVWEPYTKWYRVDKDGRVQPNPYRSRRTGKQAIDRALAARAAEKAANKRVHSISYHLASAAATNLGGKLYSDMSTAEQGIYDTLRKAGAGIAEASAVTSMGMGGIYRGTHATWAITPEGDIRRVTAQDIKGQVGGADYTPIGVSKDAQKRYDKARLGFTLTMPVTEVEGKWIYDTDAIVANPALRKAFVDKVPKGKDILLEQYKRERTHIQTATGEWYKKSDLTELKRGSPKLYNVLIKKGTAAYEKEAKKLKVEVRAEAFVTQQEIKRNYQAVPGGGYIRNSDLADMRRDYPVQAKILMTKGWDAFEKAFESAETVLDKYKGLVTVYDEKGRVIITFGDGLQAKVKKEESFNIIDAIKDGKEVEVRFLFGEKAVADAKAYLSAEEKLNTVYKGDLRLAILGKVLGKKVEPMPRTELALLYNDKVLDRTYADLKYLKDIGDEYEALLQKKKDDTLTIKERRRLTTLSAAVWHQEALAKVGEVTEKIPEGLEAAYQKIEKLPPAVRIPTDVASKFLVGAVVAAPLYIAGFTLSAVGVTYAPNKAAYAAQMGIGIATFLLSIPGQIIADPTMAAFYAGVFYGPVKALKAVKGVIRRGSPYYIENIGMRYSFTTGKIPTRMGEIARAIKAGKITEMDVARATGRVIDRALKQPQGVARAKIGRSNIWIRVEPTPVSKGLGGILWHAAPDKAIYKGLEALVDKKMPEPALFVSPHAAPRFALQSAYGAPASKPCLVMVYTKKGGLQWYPTNITYAKSLAELKAKGFQYLGSGRAKPGAYPPVKTYLGRFENEAMLPNGMKIYRATNLRSRILGASAGEFVTTIDGWTLPIFRFAERGAKIPHATLAKLSAIRIATVWHGLRVLFGKKGFKAERVRIEALTRELDTVGKRAAEGKKGKAYNTAYEKAVDTAMAQRLRRMYGRHPAALERAWRANPEQFEVAYRNRLTRNMARHYGVRVPRPSRPLGRYINIPRNIRLERRLTGRRIERAGRILRRTPTRYAPRIARIARPLRRELIRRDIPPRITGVEPRVPPTKVLKVPRVPLPRVLKKPVPKARMRRPISDKEKRKIISEGKGAFCFRMGEVGKDRDVWYTYISPYQKPEHRIIVVGKAPVGAMIVRGPGSAIKTAQMLYGKALEARRTDDIGFMDAIFEPIPERKGIRLSFKPDPGGETIGDFGTPFRLKKAEPISPRVGNITDRRVRLSNGRGIRITPRVGRLK